MTNCYSLVKYLIVGSLVEGGRVEQNDSGRLVSGRVLNVEMGRLRVAERRRNAGSSDTCRIHNIATHSCSMGPTITV